MDALDFQKLIEHTLNNYARHPCFHPCLYQFLVLRLAQSWLSIGSLECCLRNTALIFRRCAA